MAKRRPVDAVVFDLGGVLVDWNPRHLYRKLFVGDDLGMECFLATVCTQTRNEQHDRGRSFSESIAELCIRYPSFEVMIRAYRARWPEMLNGPIEGSVEALAELARSGQRLFALTNWSAETFPIALERYEFLQWFDGIVVSGDEGMAKPDVEIYELLLDRFGLTASRTLFIDDTLVNVRAAHSLGLQALHFRSEEGLREELAARHLVAATGDLLPATT